MSRMFYAGLLFLFVAIGIGQTEGPVPTIDEILPELAESQPAANQVAWTWPRQRVHTPIAVAGVRG